MAEIHLSTLQLICALNFEYPGVIVESKRAPRHPGAVRREWRLWRPELSNKHTVCRHGCWSLSFHPALGKEEGFSRRREESRRREGDPAPGARPGAGKKRILPTRRREGGILSPGEEESFKRRNRHMLMARNRAFLPAPRKIKLKNLFRASHTDNHMINEHSIHLYTVELAALSSVSTSVGNNAKN